MRAGRNPRPQRHDPQLVSELVPKVLDEVGLGATSVAARLLQVWDGALGEGLSPHCRPDGLRNGIIHARVRDSGWMQRLQLEKPRILARIASTLGGDAARELRFRLGPLDP